MFLNCCPCHFFNLNIRLYLSFLLMYLITMPIVPPGRIQLPQRLDIYYAKLTLMPNDRDLRMLSSSKIFAVGYRAWRPFQMHRRLHATFSISSCTKASTRFSSLHFDAAWGNSISFLRLFFLTPYASDFTQPASTLCGVCWRLTSCMQ